MTWGSTVGRGCLILCCSDLEKSDAFQVFLCIGGRPWSQTLECSDDRSMRYALWLDWWLLSDHPLPTRENLPHNLATVVTYIIRVNAPMRFATKSSSSCKVRSRHLWQTIERSQHLSGDLKAVIDPVIERNAITSVIQINILLSKITDDRRYIRELWMYRILRARSEE